MKFRITLILVLMMSSICLAQRKGINYKAIVKDANGAIVANQQIAVLLTIEQGAALTNVYQEGHTPTTDSNGMMVFNLGEGTVVSGDYNTIDWAADDHFLNTKINTGSGIVDMGSIEFKTVPYALQARSATMSTTNNVTSNAPGDMATDDFVFGSSQLEYDPSNGNANRRLFFDKSRGAFRVGYDGSGVWNQNMLGNYSMAVGTGTEASGSYSFASGSNSIASGTSALAMGINAEATGYNSMALGSFVLASDHYSIAMGYNTQSLGHNSLAIGFNNEAIGDYSTSIGDNNYSGGRYSIAFGHASDAEGEASIALGSYTAAIGDYSTAMGRYTDADSYGTFVIGKYNVGGGNPTQWFNTDPLFEVGDGASSSNRHNAFTVLKNGNIGINTASPVVKLQINGGIDANLNSGTGTLMIGIDDGLNLVFDSNEIMARDNQAGSPLYLQKDGGGAVWVGGSVVHSSDKRLKRDIQDLTYGLEEVLSLNPVSYYWKDRNQEHPSLGLIAQEVQPIIKNVVNIADDKDKTLSVSYTELIPVLIKAIQEQQGEINVLKSEITALKASK